MGGITRRTVKIGVASGRKIIFSPVIGHEIRKALNPKRIVRQINERTGRAWTIMDPSISELQLRLAIGNPFGAKAMVKANEEFYARIPNGFFVKGFVSFAEYNARLLELSKKKAR
ncbi:MAG: hypothetical protein NTZ73_00250 [Candidatus Diapherotrites archaeon]|nr:hypothetical protein [Candidatus Diapherotrites archaeon]